MRWTTTARIPVPVWFIIGMGILLLVGCKVQQVPASSLPSPTVPSDLPATLLAPTTTPSPIPSSTLRPPTRVWMAPYLPAPLRQALELPGGFVQSESEEGAQVRLQTGSGEVLARWVYVLAAPFPTIEDGVSFQDLKSTWGGNPSGPFGSLPLLMDEATLQVFTALWGAPASGVVQTMPSGQLLDTAWENQPSWAILPFEALEPKWKVLQIDGASPLHKDFDSDQYPLAVVFTMDGDPTGVKTILDGFEKRDFQLPIVNRDPEKMTTVMLTGVTALVRATAEEMRRHGMTYPARFIGSFLREADILHVSNEIPFTKDCPHPDTHQEELVFCSRPEYIELLDDIGTDIVELTGDHFGDQGPDAMRYTLDLYKERNWPYYGGGYNQEDARQARIIEHNGNKIAFIGCNAKGGGYATARGENPGAVACDWDWMSQEIARLRGEGYNVITTFQHFEYYTYTPQPKQIVDSHRMVQAGANIVSGSQAHQPQGMEFYQDGFIHYGLGNLFFDQFFMGVPTSQGFLDQYVFYDNRHISTEAIGIYFVDYASPRLMTPEEKKALLEAVFAASGWE